MRCSSTLIDPAPFHHYPTVYHHRIHVGAFRLVHQGIDYRGFRVQVGLGDVV